DAAALPDAAHRDLATGLALRDRAIVEVAYAAGLRISELAAADFASLDLRRGEIRVVGKGRKERVGLLGRPAIAALSAYLDEGRAGTGFVTSGRTLARAGLIVSATFLASRLLGWIRLLVIANTFDAGPELDSFFAAFRIPDLVFQLVAAGALGSALIPIVSGLL